MEEIRSADWLRLTLVISDCKDDSGKQGRMQGTPITDGSCMFFVLCIQLLKSPRLLEHEKVTNLVQGLLLRSSYRG